jgi:hypothetical protein
MVEGSVEAVSAQLRTSGLHAARFQPIQLAGEPAPDVIALKMEHVSMLADAKAAPGAGEEAYLE